MRVLNLNGGWDEIVLPPEENGDDGEDGDDGDDGDVSENGGSGE